MLLNDIESMSNIWERSEIRFEVVWAIFANVKSKFATREQFQVSDLSKESTSDWKVLSVSNFMRNLAGFTTNWTSKFMRIQVSNCSPRSLMRTAFFGMFLVQPLVDFGRHAEMQQR